MALSRAILFAITVGCATSARLVRKSKEFLSSGDGKLIKSSAGHFLTYWPSEPQRSCSAVLFSVGTKMAVEDYPDLARALTTKGFIVAIVDSQPGRMTKLDADKLAASFAYGKSNLLDWTNNACGSVDTWLMGGHSAGGGTAHKVFEADPSITDAVFSVDPAARGDFGAEIPLPGFYVGFSQSSCFVNPQDSSEMGYSLSAPGKRVLAKVTATKKWTISGGRELDYYHCSISKGCGIACNNGDLGTPDAFYTDIAQSVATFAAAVSSNRWDGLQALSSTQTPITWFVGDDLP